MSVDYYAVSDKYRRAVAITNNKGSPINGGCWTRFLCDVYYPEQEPVIRLCSEFDLPEGYKVCGSVWGGRECENENCPLEEQP